MGLPLGVEETVPGSHEYRVKIVGSRYYVDHMFVTATAGAVAYDVFNILALKTGMIKSDKGYNFREESREFLGHLVNTEIVSDQDQVPLVVKHMGRMLDTFLQRQAPVFPVLQEVYDPRVNYCFRDYNNFSPKGIDEVPGLQTFKAFYDGGDIFPDRPKRGRPRKTVQVDPQGEAAAAITMQVDPQGEAAAAITVRVDPQGEAAVYDSGDIFPDRRRGRPRKTVQVDPQGEAAAHDSGAASTTPQRRRSSRTVKINPREEVHLHSPADVKIIKTTFSVV